jgi:hypothetical protein
MKRLYLLLLFLIPMAEVISAQEPLITPNSQVNSDTLHQWLHSNDPRLIAWAADFARRTHDAKIISEMPALLEHWVMPAPEGGDKLQAEQRRAIFAVVDALVQENVQVPIPAINAVAEFYPASAAIFISRLPLSVSRPTLDDWFRFKKESRRGYVLARVAAMILAKDPEIGKAPLNLERGLFVSIIVEEAEEELRITIQSKNPSQGTDMLRGLGKSRALALSPGWPQVYMYDLDENNSQETSLPIIELDGDRIAARRFKENHPLDKRSFVQGLNPVTRHMLIAYLLGVHPKDMPWKPMERFSIQWTDKAAYQRQLGEIIGTQSEKIQTTVDALHARNLLLDRPSLFTDKYLEVWGDQLRPRIVVKIQCNINPCPLH